MVFKRLSEEEKNEIVELYRAGEKQKSLAEKFGVTQPSISHLLRAKGVKVSRKLTSGQVQEIRYALKTGKGTIKELSLRYKISNRVVDGIGKGTLYKDVPFSEVERILEERMQSLKNRRSLVLDT